MKTPAKLHVYNTNEPGGECIIVGNRNGLLKLSEQLQIAARNAVSFDRAYSGDGHSYTLMVVKEGDEMIWEHLEVPYTDEVFKEDRDEYVPVENLPHIKMYLEEKHKLKK